MGIGERWKGISPCRPDLDNKSAEMTPLILTYKPMALGGLSLLTGISPPPPQRRPGKLSISLASIRVSRSSKTASGEEFAQTGPQNRVPDPK